MAFIDEHQGVGRQVLEQGRRRLAGFTPGEVAGVVLDPLAVAHGLEHLEVERGPFVEALGLQKLALGVELGEARLELDLDVADGLADGGAGGDVVGIGVDGDGVERRRLLAGQRVELDDPLDGVAEQAEPPRPVLVMGREDLDGIAAHPEIAAPQNHVVAPVLKLHQLAQKLGPVDPLARLQGHDHLRIGLERADAVDARHRGDDDDVLALEQRPGGGVTHAVDLLVDRGVLFDVGVGARHIGLGLVIIVIGDEVLDRVVGKEGPHLAEELGGEGLVGR